MHAKDFDTCLAISPYHAFPFMFQNVPCTSIAAFCLALTTPFLARQQEIAQMDQAALGAQFADMDFSNQHDLYWQGQTYQKNGHDLDNLFEALFHAIGENEDFKDFLFETGNACLIYQHAENDPLAHILPADIYTHHLMMLRYYFGFDR